MFLAPRYKGKASSMTIQYNIKIKIFGLKNSIQYLDPIYLDQDSLQVFNLFSYIKIKFLSLNLYTLISIIIHLDQDSLQVIRLNL